MDNTPVIPTRKVFHKYTLFYCGCCGNRILMQEEDRLRREIASLKLMVDQLHETTEAPRMLTIRQTAETGILPENTLRQFVKTGKVPFIRVGNRVLINYNKLCRMLEDC